MVNYKGKHVVITGASGGMGKVLCKALANEGAKLSICAKDEAVMDFAKELSCEVFAKVVDITNEAEVKSFFTEALSKHGEFYALANLAGLSIPGQISEMEEEKLVIDEEYVKERFQETIQKEDLDRFIL